MLTLRKMDVIVIVLSAGLFLATLLINSSFVDASYSTADKEMLKPVLDHPPVVIASEAIPEVISAQLRNLERIHQASLNWADYTEVTQPRIVSPQPQNNERIYQASLNWADYTEAAQPKAVSSQLANNERIYQASLNWADYTEEAQPKVAVPQLGNNERI